MDGTCAKLARPPGGPLVIGGRTGTVEPRLLQRIRAPRRERPMSDNRKPKRRQLTYAVHEDGSVSFVGATPDPAVAEALIRALKYILDASRV